ncbi:MAG: right-handed parallel beta-helix repeat-containing protein [Desulfamplus sp.]|nr:right-handed parallel beta-helix repeat-containing protein [Desulfamplus sp.]
MMNKYKKSQVRGFLVILFFQLWMVGGIWSMVMEAEAAELDTIPAAYWEFDEENGNMAFDTSGLGNTASLVNEPVWDLGKVGGSLRFDGLNDYVDAGNNVFGLTDEVTVSMWIKPALVTSSVSQVLIQRGRYVYPFMIRIDSKKVRACIRTSNGTNYLTGQSVLVPDQWYHVVLTFADGEMILYIDGKEESRASVDGQMIITANQKTTLGANPLGQAPFAGNLDDVRIYDRALTPEEITILTQTIQDNPSPQNLSDRDFVLAMIKGNTYYLDAEYGDDATGQGTSALPWKTLAKAQSVVRSGDGVFLRNGNYGSYVENTTGRTDWVVYINDEGHTPLISNISSRFNSSRSVYLAFYGIKIAPSWVDPAGNTEWQAAHLGSTDPQYEQSALNTYMKSASPVNALYSDHLMFINCEMEGTNKHLTTYGINLNYCSDVLIKGCHIHRVVRGITYQNGSRIKVLYNHIHNITSTFIGSGAYSSDLLIEGNNCYDSNWSKTEDWCPRALNQNYHASFVSIRSSDVTIRNNIFHDGGTSSTFMLYDDPNCPDAYHNILIENNLVYDPQNQTGLRLYRVGSNIVVRNNILVGRQRYDAQPGPLQYGTAFSLSGVASGYDGSGLSVYNNIFVGMASFGEWFGNVRQGGNIFWSALTTPGGVWSFLAQTDFMNGSKVLTSRNGVAPDYFTNGFFNGELDFSWRSEGTELVIPHGHGKIIDFTYAEGSEAINFGDATNQPTDSLGTLNALGFIIKNGHLRSDSNHSAGCYEP